MVADRLPDHLANDICVVMTKPIADTANIVPGLVRSELLSEGTQLDCGFADPRKAAFGGIVLVAISDELLHRHQPDAVRDSVDVLDYVSEALARIARRQRGDPGR